MGSCTSSRRAAAAKQQQQNKPFAKKKKKSKSKVYSAYNSMDSIANEVQADRMSGIPQRKTPYTRGINGSQMTAFGFRRRAPNPVSNLPAPPQPTDNTTLPERTGRCSPHLPPTPPTTHIPLPSQPTSTTTSLSRPLASRFGFQLTPRCTAVLNNINAQLVSDSSMDPNCNPVDTGIETAPLTTKTCSDSQSTTTSSLVTANKNVIPNHVTMNGNAEQPAVKVSMLPKLKAKSDGKLLSRLPTPKSLLKPRQNSAPPSSGNKATIVKPVVVKPVIRPPNFKSVKSENNHRVPSSESFSLSPNTSGFGTMSSGETDTLCSVEAIQESPRSSRPYTLDMVLSPHKSHELNDVRPATAPTAEPEDLDDENDDEPEKAGLDEHLSEKPKEAWTETPVDEMSSSSYSEGIEEQHFEFPDNLTDKSADSLFSSCSSASSASDDAPQRSKQKKKLSSGASLSQLSDGSSEHRDFLIDDEIADQPGLTFMTEEGSYGAEDGEYMGDEEGEEGVIAEEKEQSRNYTSEEATYNGDEPTYNVDESTYNGDDTYVTVEESQQQSLKHDFTPSIQGMGIEGGKEAQAIPIHIPKGEPTPTSVRRNHRRSASVSTLSPCESITSEDLMLDFEDSQVGSTPSRLTNASQRLTDLGSEISGSDEILKEWSAMLGSVSSLKDFGSVKPLPQLRSRASSGSDVQQVPGSRLSRGSSLRPPRSTATSSAVLDSDEGCVRMDWNIYQSMVQDVMTLKTSLLKLKRVLQEAEVRNPFDSSLKTNGLYYSLAHSESLESNDNCKEDLSLRDDIADFQRQIIFLRQQLTDKDRTICLLQQEMTKYCGMNSHDTCTSETSDNLPTCNAATQTERVRPVSSGVTVAQSYTSEEGPLVSSSECGPDGK